MNSFTASKLILAAMCKLLHMESEVGLKRCYERILQNRASHLLMKAAIPAYLATNQAYSGDLLLAIRKSLYYFNSMIRFRTDA